MYSIKSGGKFHIGWWEFLLTNHKARRKLPLPKGSLKYRYKRPAGKRKYLYTFR